MDFQLLISLLALAVALVMIFAQVRLFSIDRTLKQIQQQLAAAARVEPEAPQADVPESLQTEVPPSLAKLTGESDSSSRWVIVFVLVGSAVVGLVAFFSTSGK